MRNISLIRDNSTNLVLLLCDFSFAFDSVTNMVELNVHNLKCILNVGFIYNP
jgi:hypothetical protein